MAPRVGERAIFAAELLALDQPRQPGAATHDDEPRGVPRMPSLAGVGLPRRSSVAVVGSGSCVGSCNDTLLAASISRGLPQTEPTAPRSRAPQPRLSELSSPAERCPE